MSELMRSIWNQIFIYIFLTLHYLEVFYTFLLYNIFFKYFAIKNINDNIYKLTQR